MVSTYVSSTHKLFFATIEIDFELKRDENHL